MDSDTKSWIRNVSDEKAAAAGCRFRVDRGEFVCNWIEQYLRLYEGDQAGEPIRLRDWQREATMRLFGWSRYSDRLKRWIRRFTKASIFVPKKNKKSPTMAAWGVYLMCADGEHGQKVYFAAKDGGQAREIAGKHAMEMVLSSAELSEEIEINRSLMQLTHVASRSILKPISSGDQNAAKAKEGLNGSILIDETHVVDRAFVSRISRAGISRSEPLHIEVSTAGKDPESYGKSQYDYGKRVESGDVDDQSFFFLCYEAPQSLTDESLAEDPVKWGKIANPAWGHTVHEEEYLADYHRSRDSLSDLADFKTYRLNIWQQAASPWLRMEDWNACRGEFTEDDLAGRSCCAGLDLAKIRDTTALVLVFPYGEMYQILPFFFLSEGGVRRIADKVRGLNEWVRDGHIIVTPGDVTDYNFVRREIVRLAEKFRIEEIIFDPNGAEHLTQQLNEEFGVERKAFSQSVANFNEPTKEFERLVISGGMRHNGNPMMTWQVQHTNVKTDVFSGYKRPVKPPQDSVHKIDGVVAAIMGLAGAIQLSETDNWSRPGGLRG